MASLIMRNMAVFVFWLLCDAATHAYSTCKYYDSTRPFRGRSCPTNSIITLNLSWRECQLFCLHTSRCQAVIYNSTANRCGYYTTTCPKAKGHRDMAFGLFTGRQPHHCLEWIPKRNRDFPRNRLMTENNAKFAVRMQRDGNDYVGLL